MKRKKLTIIINAFTVLFIIISMLNKRNISQLSIEEIGKELGLLTLIPTVLSVTLAFVTHNVLFSLLIGFLSGALILTLLFSTSFLETPLQFVKNAFISIQTVVLDVDNIEVLLLCFVVGGMIEVVKLSGGFEAMAIKLTKRINSPRKANLFASMLGCLILFDDYANTLIVGPIMKPITDRVKVSREKLSFIVDSTAAPISGIALISSWIGVEIASIEKGLEVVSSNTNGFLLFIKSIPFCFYCIFAVTFLFINGFIGKEFGPMLKAEIRARKGQTVSNKSKELNEEKTDVQTINNLEKRIFTGLGGVILLVIFAIVSFYINGNRNAIEALVLAPSCEFSFANIMTSISYADTVNLITLAATIGTAFTILLGRIYKLFTFKESIKSWLGGIKEMGSTVLMLMLAWILADVVNRLGTTYYVVEIISANVNSILVPLLIFASCCLISCASGSFGCMFVVMPLAIPLSFKMISLGTMINDEIYLSICVGSVIAGSIFGDHCSPIADCTILSATGTGCDTMEHCYTQLPYTIVNCVISAIFGIIFTSLGMNVFVALLIGILFQAIIMFTLGKKPI